MPTFQGQVTEENVVQLIEYIKSLAARPPARFRAITADARTNSSFMHLSKRQETGQIFRHIGSFLGHGTSLGRPSSVAHPEHSVLFAFLR
jgi:hypothetical protein